MAIETFRRVEKKYLIDHARMWEFRRQLQPYVEPDAYNRDQPTYPICNIYYDTPDDQLIRTSLQKPAYKEKLRLRSYGIPEPDGKVYVELKKKAEGVVYKRRSAMTLYEACAFLHSGQPPQPRAGLNPQVLSEIAWFLHQYDLQPKLALCYRRCAFFGREDPDLRISFDTDIRTRRTNLRLECGTDGRLLLAPGQWLMEIKAAGGMPLWLCRLLSEYEIYPTSFSKYGTEFTEYMEARSCLHPSFQPQRTAAPSLAFGRSC